MITSFVLSLREGLEAALIIGIVLGALRRTGRPDLRRPLWVGVIFAVILSLLAALVLRLVGLELEGTAEQVYEGTTYLLAAGVLTWMIFWMFRQARQINVTLEKNVSQAATQGGVWAIFFLSFIAVLREGIELGLYLVAASLASGGLQTVLGTLTGLTAACLLGYFLYTTTIRLDLRRFFQVTSLILILFAAGLIAHGIAEFNEAGLIPALINPVWNLTPYLDHHSTIGSILSALFGYNASPSLTMALGYSAYVLVILYFFLKARKIQVG